MHSYMNNFNFSLYALNRGYIWSMFTCHFAHDGFFGTLIDSVILFLLSGSVAQMNGQLFLALMGRVERTGVFEMIDHPAPRSVDEFPPESEQWIA